MRPRPTPGGMASAGTGVPSTAASTSPGARVRTISNSRTKGPMQPSSWRPIAIETVRIRLVAR